MKQPEIIVNDVFSHFFFDCKKRWAVFMGGAGSGKSTVVADKIIFRILIEKPQDGQTPHRFLALRKVANTIKRSVFQNFKDRIDYFGVTHEFIFNLTDLTITHKPTGSMIWCLGMDDPEKIKSIQGVSSIWVEEATEFVQDDIDILDTRLRGNTVGYKQIMLTFNPIDENHFIKERFFDNPDEDVYTSISTLYQNAFCDEPYKRAMEKYQKTDPYKYSVYVLAMWGQLMQGGEFYKGYSITRNTRKGLEYDPTMPLHFSFDENVHPYMTCTVYQMNGKRIWQIGEYTHRDPKNTIKAVCADILIDYRAHNSTCYIYGDPSMKKQDAAKEKGENSFTLIYKYLKPLHPELRLLTSAPNVPMRGRFMSDLFLGEIEGCEFVIDSETCKMTLEEYANVKEDADGRKNRTKKKNPKTGVSYEPYNHISDSAEYFICMVLKEEFEAFQRGGPKQKPIVVTRSTQSQRIGF